MVFNVWGRPAVIVLGKGKLGSRSQSTMRDPWHDKSRRMWKRRKKEPRQARNSAAVQNLACHCSWWCDRLQWWIFSGFLAQWEIQRANLYTEGRCLAIQVVCAFQRSNKASMVKLRQRQPSRRGPGRGSSSRTPAADEHHHCCCCYCHRRARATQLQHGQFVEVGNSREGGPLLPAFGSVVFTLGDSRDATGVNAHISVMFTRIPESEEAEAPAGMVATSSARASMETMETMGTMETMETLPKNSSKEDKGKGSMEETLRAEQATLGTEEDNDSGPYLGPAPDGMDEATWKAMWAGVPEGRGWCYVVEDPSLNDESDSAPQPHSVPPLATRKDDQSP